MLERSTSGVELRAEGRRLTGPAMVYGDVSPSHRERFESGAFDLPDNRTRSLNLRHHALETIVWSNGGGLDVADSRDQLQLVANVPDTPAGNVALRDVAAGLLNGFSIEFNALSERRDHAGLRVLEKANLNAFGLVKIPSLSSKRCRSPSRVCNAQYDHTLGH